MTPKGAPGTDLSHAQRDIGLPATQRRLADWERKRREFTADVAALRAALAATAPALTPGEERAERQGRAAVLERLAPGGEARLRAGRMIAEARAKRPKREEG